MTNPKPRLNQDIEKCNLPPLGWYCTRKAGHDGPCAALPTESNWKGKAEDKFVSLVMKCYEEACIKPEFTNELIAFISQAIEEAVAKTVDQIHKDLGEHRIKDCPLCDPDYLDQLQQKEEVWQCICGRWNDSNINQCRECGKEKSK